MSRHETHTATQEAKRGLSGSSAKHTAHQDAIGKYLSAIAYEQRHKADEDKDEGSEQAPPVSRAGAPGPG